MILYPVGSTRACIFAAGKLKELGIPLVDHPTPEVSHLLLDVPSFESDGQLRGGCEIHKVLERLPDSITVIGGNLQHPALEAYRKWDLLQDANYLAGNAAITADCAIRTAAAVMETTFADSPTLIIGWGRIGKCLGKLLKALDCDVTIAARKERDRAMLSALGCKAIDIPDIPGRIRQYRLLFNTVPELIVEQDLPESCIAIDLASRRGITGEKVIWARGLPGKTTPESSGNLIAQTIEDFLRRRIP